MEKKPSSEQCVKGICKAIESYCEEHKCPARRSLANARAVYFVVIRDNDTAMVHLVGEATNGEIIEAMEHTILEMVIAQRAERNPLAT